MTPGVFDQADLGTAADPMTGRWAALLSIDPGIDDLGWALWRWPRKQPWNHTTCHPLRVVSGTARTKTEWSDEYRLKVLGEELATQLRGQQGLYLHRVAVEVPATDGTYDERAGRVRGRGFTAGAMKHVHRIAGLCTWLAVQEGGLAQFVRAKAGRGSEKKIQHGFLQAAWGAEHWAALGRTSEDERDALCLGCRVLTTPALYAWPPPLHGP